MEGVWTWKDTVEEGDMETPEFMMEIVEGDKLWKEDVCLKTFLRAYSCHHPPTSPTSSLAKEPFPIHSTGSSVSILPLKSTSSVPKLSPHLPAHHPPPSPPAKAGPQELPSHH